MSKIGKLPVEIPAGVIVSINGQNIEVNGPKGKLTYTIPAGIKVAVEENKVVVSQEEATKELTKALFGLTRATIANLIQGASKGFEKKLELSGVGYRAQTSGAELNLSIGFSHPVKIKAPTGITFAVAENVITISGTDPVIVGDLAAKIRGIRPPEPYKGKGIKYKDEKIRRKAGKSAKAVGGAGAK